jgi:hypothetical protein
MDDHTKRLEQYTADKAKLRSLEMEISKLKLHISNTHFPYCGACGKQSWCNATIPENGCFTPK